MRTPYLSLKNIGKTYRFKGKVLHALTDINLEIHQGETLGIVGESGSGKSTLGKIAASLEPASTGHAAYYGIPIPEMNRSQKKVLRRSMQVIFQDHSSSLNPMMTIGQSIAEGIDIHRLAFGDEKKKKIIALLEAVGLPADAMERYPHEFSGGQRQRIVIARALAVDPEFLVCDEPLAALDTCTQRQVVDLLKKLKEELRLTMLFISHDISAVKAIADHVAVMYLGAIVEHGPAAEVLVKPVHPYTQALIRSVPLADPVAERSRMKILLPGDPPSPLDPPRGCPFHPRCKDAFDLCRKERPRLHTDSGSRKAACHIVSNFPT